MASPELIQETPNLKSEGILRQRKSSEVSALGSEETFPSVNLVCDLAARDFTSLSAGEARIACSQSQGVGRFVQN
jgi:hypothetical protein